ncbi:response regulator transcription factor [Petralouisia muris]|uniref:response regulator transcription factor n=1 Tax=Petralouisia muris TaxID=3032872 RepID=UPI0014421619|nr:response regulator [Petralouisia muris]
MEKILVLEDDRLLNEALCQMLSAAGYEVKQAYSLQEAQGLLDGGLDLLLVDIGLPDGEGLEICRGSQNTGKIPVIFLTARDEEEDIVIKNVFGMGYTLGE